ncbi:MAG: signal peptidase I [Gemmatimonadetes bacterium]|jgi:signal peptidase I|nr:signal peptidase I [Gemmatimonadota bacterium]
MPDTKRKWWMAVFLSLLSPGLGQIYNGQAKKGIGFYFLLFVPGLAAGLGIAVGIPFVPLVFFSVAISLLALLFIYLDAFVTARKQAENYQYKPYNKWQIYLLALLVSNLFIGPLGKHLQSSCFMQAFYIPSGAMEETLLVGDYLMANKFVYGASVNVPGTNIILFRLPGQRDPEPGDIVIFRSPVDPDRDLIKRCVAVGGQKVHIVNKELYIDGERSTDPLSAKHEDPHSYPASINPRDNFGPYMVPEDHFFMIGDNRDNSLDSRYWRAIPRELIKGKAAFIYWSWDSGNGGRWNRLYQSIQ